MPSVVAVHRDGEHRFSKRTVDRIELVAGVGVVGDAHAGPLVRHRSRVAADPGRPNLRQVHLIAAELFDVLAAAGHPVHPGDLGENVTTAGVDLHGLSVGSVLRLGGEVLVAVTGLRNPCAQIDAFRPGVLALVSGRAPDGSCARRAGIMGVVIHGGFVAAGDPIEVSAPPGPPRPLDRV